MGWLAFFAIIGIIIFVVVKFKGSGGSSPSYITDEEEIKSKIIGRWHYDSNPNGFSAPCYTCYFKNGGVYSYYGVYQTAISQTEPGNLGQTNARANYSISGTTVTFSGIDENKEDSINVFSGGQSFSTEIRLTDYSLSFQPPGVGKKITFYRDDK